MSNNLTDMQIGKVVVFGLPGAFTPTCSSTHLPGFEEKYDQLIEAGVREVYCVSVNDSFVMQAWAKDLGVSKVKMVADGNLEFTDKMNMRVSKSNLGFQLRNFLDLLIQRLKVFDSWRWIESFSKWYSPGQIENIFFISSNTDLFWFVGGPKLKAWEDRL